MQAETATNREALVDPSTLMGHVVLERYRYVLSQLHTVNENSYRFLALYQTVTSAIVGLGWLLFASRAQLNLNSSSVRLEILGLMGAVTLVAAFTLILVVVGLFTWLDYRSEECDLLERFVASDIRVRPRLRHIYRWYETYIAIFVVGSLAAMWWFVFSVILPMV